jgi:hypothetical protein
MLPHNKTRRCVLTTLALLLEGGIAMLYDDYTLHSDNTTIGRSFSTDNFFY